jgi:hypothetical protein
MTNQLPRDCSIVTNEADSAARTVVRWLHSDGGGTHVLQLWHGVEMPAAYACLNGVLDGRCHLETLFQLAVVVQGVHCAAGTAAVML